MFNGDKRKLAEFCLDHFERFFSGIRRKDNDAIDYAEVHAAALFLCEDASFEQMLRERWSKLQSYHDKPPDTGSLDFLIDVAPDLLDGFFSATRDFIADASPP